MLRGGDFAAACRDSSCQTPLRLCGNCAEQGSCHWFLVFGQQLTVDPEALRRHQKPPLPFVFSFSVPETSSGLIECRLVVVGRAIHCLDLLLRGVSHLLGSRDCPFRCTIVRITSRDYHGTALQLGDGDNVSCPENLFVLSVSDIPESRSWGAGQLEITLKSPLRLLSDGRQLIDFDFSLFARSLIRRVSSIAFYYGDCELNCDYSGLSRQAHAITCISDRFVYTSLSGNRKKLSGIMGSGIFSGDVSDLLPFLSAGLYLHTGKGASYGLGEFEIQTQMPIQ